MRARYTTICVLFIVIYASHVEKEPVITHENNLEGWDGLKINLQSPSVCITRSYKMLVLFHSDNSAR